MYGWHRLGALVGAALALLRAHAAFAASTRSNSAATRHVLNDKGRADVSAARWPQQGQAALGLGDARPAASRHEQPVAVASLAKVMTASLTLERYPLSDAQDGFTITVTAAQAQAGAQDATQDQSAVAVQPGEQLTERQLLEALLIPSGNNIAPILATGVVGSETRFVAVDPGTVFTAADRPRVFERAMRLAVFRQIVSMPSVTLPVAGTLTNFDPLIAEGYAGRTGSDATAGGCLACFTHVTVGGHGVTAQLVDSVAPGTRVRTRRDPLLSASGPAAAQN